MSPLPSSRPALSVAASAALLAAMAGSASGSATGAVTGWHRVHNAQAGKGAFLEFAASFVASAGDSWVAGTSDGSGQATHQAILEHSTRGSFVLAGPGQIHRADDTLLNGLSGTSSDDVWAVGRQSWHGGPTHGLILHWAGDSWQKIPQASDEPADSTLTDVSADSPSDVWAVGNSAVSAGVFGPLIEHYDGKAWHVSPGFSQIRTLYSVAAISPTDVWTVGILNDDTPPIVEHFDGKAWSVVDQPVHQANSALNDVVALGPNNVWAVGFNTSHTLVEHWDGHTWAVVPSQDVGQLNMLISVTARSAHDIYAVGDSGVGFDTPLIEHWDGHQWTVQSTPAPGAADTLTSVAAAANAPVIAAGSLVQGHQPYRRLGLVLRHE